MVSTKAGLHRPPDQKQQERPLGDDGDYLDALDRADRKYGSWIERSTFMEGTSVKQSYVVNRGNKGNKEVVWWNTNIDKPNL